jgi:hypothetical protein
MLNKRWDGLMVCPDDWEIRQPQDFVRGVADTIVPPWVRPEQEDTFIFVCTPVTNQGIADYGVADCARADINNNLYPQCTSVGALGIAGDAVAGCAVAGRTQPGLNQYLYNNS